MIRIIYTSQFVKTVGLEDVFGFSEIRISNFWTNKKGNLREKLVNSQSWQGHKDLNPEPTVLETAALPIELYPYIYFEGGRPESTGGPSGIRTRDYPVMSRRL